ncbi:MAG: hypothetical protein KTR31_16025 [Myxococcales bacterium]|nr:hypothetical protein [Myxococcales bacterium]
MVEPRVKLGTLCRAMTQLVRRAERSAAAGVRATCLLEADAAACAALYYLRVARRGAQEGANLLEEIRSTLVTLTRNSFVEGQPSAISLDEALDSSNGHRHFS